MTDQFIYFRDKEIKVKNILRLQKKGITQISEIVGLNGLHNLEELDLENNKIVEISGFEELKNLKVLNLQKNNIKIIQGLENLSNLEILYLDYNDIMEIKGLNRLLNLKELYLSNNQISDIKNLENLINLTDLDLNHNNINEIKGLHYCIKLEFLDLSHNNIKEFQNLGDLDKLYQLKFSNNPVNKEEQHIQNFWNAIDIVDFCKNKSFKRKELQEQGFIFKSEYVEATFFESKDTQIGNLSGSLILTIEKLVYISESRPVIDPIIFLISDITSINFTRPIDLEFIEIICNNNKKLEFYFDDPNENQEFYDIVKNLINKQKNNELGEIKLVQFSALDYLKKKYIDGEITEEDYLRKKQVLEQD